MQIFRGSAPWGFDLLLIFILRPTDKNEPWAHHVFSYISCTLSLLYFIFSILRRMAEKNAHHTSYYTYFHTCRVNLTQCIRTPALAGDAKIRSGP